MKHVVAIAALGLTLSAAQAQEIGGRYQVAGTNMDGTPYKGEAQITRTSDVTCEIVWVTGGTTSSGICMRSSNAFTAAYALGGKVGLVIYKVMPDGRLNGTWTMAGLNAVGTEVLTPN